MKFYLLLLLFLSSCASRTSQITTDYRKLLPVRQGAVTYYTNFYRAHLDTSQANTKIKYWVNTHYTVFGLQSLKPDIDKSKLVYSGSMPARRFYDTRARRVTYPPINFNLAIANKTDSSIIWVTDLEVFDQQKLTPIEKHHFADNQFTTTWLSNLNTALNDLIVSLRKQLDQQR